MGKKAVHMAKVPSLMLISGHLHSGGKKKKTHVELTGLKNNVAKQELTLGSISKSNSSL